MANKKKKKQRDAHADANQSEHNQQNEPIDPYTGEVEPPAEGAYKITEITSQDPGIGKVKIICSKKRIHSISWRWMRMQMLSPTVLIPTQTIKI